MSAIGINTIPQIAEETYLEKFINNKPLLIFYKLPISRFYNSLENCIIDWSKEYKKIIVLRDRPETTKDPDVLMFLFNVIEKSSNVTEVLGFVEKKAFALIDLIAQKNFKIRTKSDSLRVLEYTRNLPLQTLSSSVIQSMQVRIHLYACSKPEIDGELTTTTSFAPPLDYYLSDFAERIEQPLPVDSTWTRDVKELDSFAFAVIGDKKGESNSSKQATSNKSDNTSGQFKPTIAMDSREASDTTNQTTTKKEAKSAVLFTQQQATPNNSDYIAKFVIKQDKLTLVSLDRDIKRAELGQHKQKIDNPPPVLDTQNKPPISDAPKQATSNNSGNPAKLVLEQSKTTVVAVNTNSREKLSKSTLEAVKRKRFNYNLEKMWVTRYAALFEEIGLNLQQYLGNKPVTKTLIKNWLYKGEGFKFFNNFSDLDFFLDFMSDNGWSSEFTKDEFTDFVTDLFFQEKNSDKEKMKACIKRFLQEFALSSTEYLFLTYLKKVKKINLKLETVFQESHAYDYFSFVTARVILNSNDYPKVVDDYAGATEDFYYSVMCAVRNCRLNDDWIRFTAHPEWLGYVKFIGGEKFIPKIDSTTTKVENKWGY